MRRQAIAGICLMSFVGCSVPVYADEIPQRRPGLWEISLVPGDGSPSQSMKQCIDSDTDIKMLQLGTDLGGSMSQGCSKNEIKKTANGFTTHSVCRAMGSTVTSKGDFVGDFSISYTGTVSNSFSPPLFGQRNAEAKVVATWVGACGPALYPGDIVMSNGMRMNIETIKKALRKAASTQ